MTSLSFQYWCLKISISPLEVLAPVMKYMSYISITIPGCFSTIAAFCYDLILLNCICNCLCIFNTYFLMCACHQPSVSFVLKVFVLSHGDGWQTDFTCNIYTAGNYAMAKGNNGVLWNWKQIRMTVCIYLTYSLWVYQKFCHIYFW